MVNDVVGLEPYAGAHADYSLTSGSSRPAHAGRRLNLGVRP